MKRIWLLAAVCSGVFAGMVFADAFEMNRRIGRGVNMGNMLEAPSEGEWGVKLDESYFAIIKQKGFQSVRIPVRWSAEGRSSKQKPYKISEEWFQRMDRAIDAALKAGLVVVVNFHHYNELFADADGQSDRFKAMWEQIALRYRNKPDALLFEIMNEPNGQLTADRWNNLYSEVLAIIRKSNPTRCVVVGTADWGGIGALKALKLPANDKNIIVTVHYYNPFTFTHQGAEWVGPQANAWLGTRWTGDYFEKTAVNDEMEGVAAWAKSAGVPIYVGEFGAYSKADMESRARWAAYCGRTFERLGFSWTWWEFCSGFGVYNAEQGEWIEPLTSALLSNDVSILKVPPMPVAKGKDIIVNGDFSKGTDSWTFGAWQGKAEGNVVDGVFRFTISEPSSESWNIQLLQPGLKLRDGKSYLVTFDAWAEKDRSFSAGLENSENYTGYGGSGTLTAGPNRKTFSFKVNKKGDDPKGRLSFSFGGDKTAISIDNVKVVELE